MLFCAGALGADPEPATKGGPGGFPRSKPAAKADEKKKDSPPPMSSAPAPKSGSMPTGPAPKGKLGTEPTARGQLGTEPKPGDPKDRPPRFN
jgi:hypothetical protein